MAELPDDPVVSVVLCTYEPDQFENFQDAAESVFAQTYDPVELVVVVDGSEVLYELVEAAYGGRDEVILHLNDTNVGLLESRNTGVELANGDIVAFIDDDAIAETAWIEELVTTYREHGALAAGGKMVPKWVAGKPMYLPEEFYWLVGVTHRGFADVPGEVRNTFGSNISFRRRVFLDLDGFDTKIGGRMGGKNLQGGETELCARLHSSYNVGVFYNPDAIVAHKVFEYRTRPHWLLDRAFWQGYSKQRMAKRVPADGGEEHRFLRRLLVEFLPSRLRGLIVDPSIDQASQMAWLLILTGTVGAGYLYASVKPNIGLPENDR